MRKLKLKRNKYKGKLIVIEGVEKSGKTTYANVLGEYFIEKYNKEDFGYLKCPSVELFNSRLFRIFRYDKSGDILNANSLLLLIMSELTQITKEVIIPYLKQGKTIICEGYLYFAFCYLLHNKIKGSRWFYRFKKAIIKPNIVFYVDVEYKTSIKRILEYDDKRIIDVKKYKKFTNRFNKIAKKSNFVKVSGNDNNITCIKDLEKILKENKVI